MPTNKLLTYLYFFLLILDALGVIYPETIDRRYVTFLPLPVLIILYLYTAKKLNWWYVTALISTFLGIVFFNISSLFKVALIFYALGVCFYVIVTLKKAIIIPIRTIFLATIPFLIVYLVPLFLYYDAVRVEIFNYIMFYVFFVGLFFFISTLVYINQKNKVNLWLLSSGIVFLLSTIIHGYYLFFEKLVTIRVGIVITFLFMHYAMYRYTIAQNNYATIQKS
jgi:hypothetical protein